MSTPKKSEERRKKKKSQAREDIEGEVHSALGVPSVAAVPPPQ